MKDAESHPVHVAAMWIYLVFCVGFILIDIFYRLNN
jgi:thiosulfate reductase cytochrome b subunit